MNPNEYNVNEFNVSDLTPAGLGHCINRNILVFSTDQFDSVKVFAADCFNKSRPIESDIPVILAHDSHNLHYESLLPQSDFDIVKCIALVTAILNGIYDKTSPRKYWEEAVKSTNLEAFETPDA